MLRNGQVCRVRSCEIFSFLCCRLYQPFKTAMCSAVAWVEGRVLYLWPSLYRRRGKKKGLVLWLGWHICQIDGAWKKEEEEGGYSKKGGGSWFGVVKNGLVHLGPVWKEGYLRCRAVGLVSREQESFIKCSKGVTRSVLNFPHLQKSVFDFSIFTKKEKSVRFKVLLDLWKPLWNWPLHRCLESIILTTFGVASLRDSQFVCVEQWSVWYQESTAKRFPIKIKNNFWTPFEEKVVFIIFSYFGPPQFLCVSVTRVRPCTKRERRAAGEKCPSFFFLSYPLAGWTRWSLDGSASWPQLCQKIRFRVDINDSAHIYFFNRYTK